MFSTILLPISPNSSARMRRGVSGLNVADDFVAVPTELGRGQEEGRLDRAGCDRVGWDPEARPLAAHALHERDHPPLGGRVDRRALRADPPRLRGDAHDPPVL